MISEWKKKNEDHSNCQEIIAEKSEFEILKKRENKPQEGFLLNSREKQRLIELRNKYSKKQSNETTEDKQKKLFLAYFQQNNIKSAKLVNNKILLEYNSGDKETKEVNTGELQQISNYLKSINKKEISLSSLEQTKNRVTSSDNKSNFNLKSPLVIGGISVGILAILGSVIYFFTRNKTKDN